MTGNYHVVVEIMRFVHAELAVSVVDEDNQSAEVGVVHFSTTQRRLLRACPGLLGALHIAGCPHVGTYRTEQLMLSGGAQCSIMCQHA